MHILSAYEKAVKSSSQKVLTKAESWKLLYIAEVFALFHDL